MTFLTTQNTTTGAEQQRDIRLTAPIRPTIPTTAKKAAEVNALKEYLFKTANAEAVTEFFDQVFAIVAESIGKGKIDAMVFDFGLRIFWADAENKTGNTNIYERHGNVTMLPKKRMTVAEFENSDMESLDSDLFDIPFLF